MADRSFETGRGLACDATRVTLWLLPVAAIVAGSSPELVRAIFGDAFAPAGPLLSVLIAAGVANVALVVALTITTAMGYPARTALLSVPLAPLALVGHQFVIPHWGSSGAALVTCVVTCVGAAATLVAVHRWWRVSPPAATWFRSGIVALGAGAAATIWPAPGIMVFIKLAVLGVASLLGLWATGEFRPGELAEVRLLFRGKTEPSRVV
jgi:O-antigen/teichoic acid export membrane protein